MDKQQIDQIRKMVIHGLYSVTLKNGYQPDVFAAFKAEQNRLFDNYEANMAKKEHSFSKPALTQGRIRAGQPTPRHNLGGNTMKSHFFAYISRMRFIQRWALMRNTAQENVQEHSHQVAVLAHALAVFRNE